MEKWNSKIARELGLEEQIVDAVNVAVRHGRQQMHAARKLVGPLTIQFRKDLVSSGLKLFMFNQAEHPLPRTGQPGEIALFELIEKYSRRFSPEVRQLFTLRNFYKGSTVRGCNAQLFLIAASPEEAVHAIVLSLRHNYPQEVSEHTRWMMKDAAYDVSTMNGWFDFVAWNRAKGLNRPDSPPFIEDSWHPEESQFHGKDQASFKMLRVAVEALEREEIQSGHALWPIVTGGLSNGSVLMHPDGAIWHQNALQESGLGCSKKDFAWEFLSALMPYLTKSPAIRLEFEKLLRD